MNDDVRSGDTDDCPGIVFECIDEGTFDILWQCCVEGKTSIPGVIDENITGSLMMGNQINGMFQVGGIIDIAQAGCCAGNGPFVFFSRL